MKAFEHQDGDLLLRLRIQPRAAKDELIWQDGRLRLRITAPPVDGKANAHLCAYLAKLFGVPRGQVELLSGETSRDKRVRIRKPRKFPPSFPQFP
ncbi:MAG: YggU family protein [Xanthomonadaceae bacterium]|nr:YggU family protein [Xanthomonadaceae bacterium]